VNTLERFRATMNYEKVDRVPLREFGAWPETLERWKREGFEPGIDYFGNDRWEGGAGTWFWPTPAFERKVISEDEERITYVDSQGIVLKELKNNPMSSMPQFIRFPVETRKDFRKFWKERMQTDLTERAGPDWKERLRKHRNRDYPFIVIADRWGGIDKRALAKGPGATRAELKRIAPLVREGGYIPMLDHSATPDISWKNYRYFIEELKKIL